MVKSHCGRLTSGRCPGVNESKDWFTPGQRPGVSRAQEL